MELHDGDIIVFKDIISVSRNSYIDIFINFNINGNSNNFISIRNYNVTSDSRNNDIRYYYDNVRGTLTFNGANDSWVDNSFKTIIIRGDQTITDENAINWLYENTVSGLPPRVMENMYAVVGDQIQYSFSNIGDVVGSIVNNGVLTIFTLGIFIISLAVGLLRRLSRRKNFK